MLVVGEGVDGGDAGEIGEFLDVALGEGADDGAVEHSAQDAGGVLDGFAAAKLDIAGGKEHDLAAELADADLEGDAGACGRFGEDMRPGLAGQRLRGVMAAFRLEAPAWARMGAYPAADNVSMLRRCFMLQKGQFAGSG